MLLTSKKAPFGLDEWLEELSQMDAVTMGAIIRELNKLTDSEESSVQQLSKEILKDPTLTSKIIKVANSVLYNPSKTPVTTISRAIMHIGFNTVRAICVSAVVIESIMKQHPRESLIRQMARSFHAAIQARNLCDKARLDVKEEVFVAALLLHLGELMIWAYPHQSIDKAYRLYQQGGTSRDIESVLGVTFERLTVELVAQWNLGGTLAESLSEDKKDQSRMSQAVCLGDEIAIAMEKGWDSLEMEVVLKKVSVFSNQPVDVAKKRLRASMDEATQLSKLYCDPKLTQLLKETCQVVDESLDTPPLLHPNPQVQLQTLQATMHMMSGNLDTGKLFQLIMTGLHEGVGLERVALAIFNQSRTQVSAKYVVGARTVNWRERYRFAYEKKPDNLFSAVMQRRESVWLGSSAHSSVSKLRGAAFDELVGSGDCLLGPILAGNREVGFLYADMRVSGRPMTETYFSGFKHFLQQTSLCLGLLANKR
ncbi:signal transduction protein [Hahella sp. CCB-MM4]|uniref:HDOD domain-containing protein n=1 Tax=Hahella sp. (strain CCB-MM4) TaxID=1926491 RepID=UPI000B9B758A|nr:HDOD domain-containing protein [Hahella sp. CCB-MM4]OZG73642.1 signal transduction protein [Hahella sp. CCB-MM4]